MDEAKEALGDTPLAEDFLNTLHKQKGRYIRDQLRIVMTITKNYEPDIIRLALLACKETKMASAVDLRDFADYAFKQVTLDDILSNPPIRLMSDIPKTVIGDIKVIQREPATYMDFVKRGGN